MQNIVKRQRIYDLYWYFAAERLAIFEKRLAGKPKPWTTDPILAEYKFCNVFRIADKVSQYLVKSIVYSKEPSTPEDRLFQIIAFRFFSKPETWDAVISKLGRQPTIQDLADGKFLQAIEHAKQQNKTIYTNAFILCANNAFGKATKHQNHVELFKLMFLHDDLAKKLLAAKSLQQIYRLLHKYPLMGDFMSYQVAIDLNYSEHINFNENDFVVAGPGAKRGIEKAFLSTGKATAEDVINYMVKNQSKEFKRLGLEFNGLNGRMLHAIDAQGLFCELDKYCRVAAPELKSSRVRIKTKFKPSAKNPSFFLPPKWTKNT